MAIESTRDLCLSVADAIREKKGSSDLINPQDFAKEIASIEGGGSGESGSNVEYLDVSGLDYGSKNQLLFYSLIVRTSQFEVFGQVQEPMVNLLGSFLMIIIADTANFSAYSNAVTAIGMDFTMQTKSSSSGIMTVLDELKVMPIYEQLDSIPRLTKEQFYDLNA
jgi:hypothetical protein